MVDLLEDLEVEAMAEEVTEAAEKPILIQVFVYSDKVEICSYHIPSKKFGLSLGGPCSEADLGKAVNAVIRKIKEKEIEVTGSLIPVTKVVEEIGATLKPE